MKRVLIGLLISIGSSTTYATDLLDIYHQALLSDPSFQSATANRMALGEQLPQSWAGLLPNLTFNTNTTGNRYYSQANPELTAAIGPIPSRFNSKGYTLTLSQPLIDFNAVSTVFKARAVVAAANANYAAAAQNLIYRTAKQYFDILRAQDNLRFTQAQQASIAKQLDQAKARYSAGVDAVTSVYNAQASYDSLVAQEIADKNAVVNSYEQLQTLTNQLYTHVAVLKNKLPLVKPMPEDIHSWVAQAEAGNAILKAARYTADAARQDIHVSESNHLPTVSAVGNYTYTATNNSALNNITSVAGRSNAIGLSVTAPIFQGGLVTSQVRAAQDNYAKTSADLEGSHRDIVTQTHQTYNNIIAGISKIQADQQAITSKQSAFESNDAAFRAGTMTILDVLNAEQDLYNSQKIYANDQYDYLLNTLMLKQLAGSLSENDLRLINAWLIDAADDTTNNKIQSHTKSRKQQQHKKS